VNSDDSKEISNNERAEPDGSEKAVTHEDAHSLDEGSITTTSAGDSGLTTNPSSVFPSVLFLLPAWIMLAWWVSKLKWYWDNTPELQFGWVVLILSIYLIWDRWESKPKMHPRFRVSGWALFVLGTGLLFIVQIYQAALGTMSASILGLTLGMMLMIAANLNYVFGWKGISFFAFPFLFLIIAIPMPSIVYGTIIAKLQISVAWLNVEILNLMGIAAEKRGSVIQLADCAVGIDEACSGIRSLQSTIMATLFIGFLTLKNFALRTMLFIVGIALALFGNLVRSVFLSYMANSNGVEAIDQFHDAAGWSILLFTTAGVFFFSWMIGKLEAVNSKMESS
jgi:exosortase